MAALAGAALRMQYVTIPGFAELVASTLGNSLEPYEEKRHVDYGSPSRIGTRLLQVDMGRHGERLSASHLYGFEFD